MASFQRRCGTSSPPKMSYVSPGPQCVIFPCAQVTDRVLQCHLTPKESTTAFLGSCPNSSNWTRSCGTSTKDWLLPIRMIHGQRYGGIQWISNIQEYKINEMHRPGHCWDEASIFGERISGTCTCLAILSCIGYRPDQSRYTLFSRRCSSCWTREDFVSSLEVFVGVGGGLFWVIYGPLHGQFRTAEILRWIRWVLRCGMGSALLSLLFDGAPAILASLHAGAVFLHSSVRCRIWHANDTTGITETYVGCNGSNLMCDCSVPAVHSNNIRGAVDEIGMYAAQVAVHLGLWLRAVSVVVQI